ncbi:MAG: bifunctional diguanylate cyclase/phosphodiesterase [Actinomycetia bacterium]|nr:bifunctional diguanylate cyclase/phosphodiesterase [Actinomycetes bacterium]
MPNARQMAVAGAAIVATGAGLSVLQLCSWGPKSVRCLVTDLVVLSVALAAAACAVAAAGRAAGRRRAAWICMAIGCGGFAAGQLMWTYPHLVGAPHEFQSVAGFGYAAMPLGAGLALLFLWCADPRSTRLRVALDGMIVAGALFGAIWMTLLGTVYSVRSSQPLELALTLAYPLAGIALVTLALLLLARFPAAERPMVAMLTAGLVLMAISGTAYAYATTVLGQNYEAIPLGYFWGLLAISGAALVSREAPDEPVAKQAPAPSRLSMWIPFVPLAIGAAASIPILVPRLGPFYLVGIATILAVMLRFLLMLGENRRLLTEVSDKTLRDPLTGLANRAQFTDRLQHAIEPHRSGSLTLAVLLLDLDGFKLVNESLGPAAADLLLVGVGERLAESVPDNDTVARLDRDTFAVLLEGKEAESRVAQRVVEAFDLPFVIDGEELLVRPSVGLAVAARDGSAVTADELLRQADVAMHAAKRSPSGQLVIFAPKLDPHRGVVPAGNPGAIVTGRRGSPQLLGELRHAIERAGLVAVYQPKIDLRTRQIVGVEALARWPHPRHGLLAPDRFLPMAREHGLLNSLTSLMLNLALDDAAEWKAKGVGIPVSVNIAAPSLSGADLPRQIMAALDARDLQPEMLTVEITEDLLLENTEGARTALTMLRDCRIRTSIDDFGTGYSALRYLRDFPVHEVKIDRQFIAPILTDASSAAIVRAVIDLAHVLGVTTVAEGVENAETAAKLLEYGCDVAQGYHYSRPVPAPAIFDLLASRGEPTAASPTSDSDLPSTRRTARGAARLS